jgi:sterol 3beta-glucosyltransferase
MRQQEGLPPVKSVLQEGWFSKILNLIAISPTLFSSQPDWEDHFYVCGFFNVSEQEESLPMPDSLEKFLNSGSLPVYMTFEAMMEGDPSPGDITRLKVEAALAAGCRAIIQSRWDVINGIPEHPDIFRIARAAHQHVFPRCAAVVHAGGAGTTQSATRAGCPSVVVAHAADQT